MHVVNTVNNEGKILYYENVKLLMVQLYCTKYISESYKKGISINTKDIHAFILATE